MAATDMCIPHPHPLRRLVAYKTNEKLRQSETHISIFIVEKAYVSAAGIVFVLLMLRELKIMNLNLNTKWI